MRVRHEETDDEEKRVHRLTDRFGAARAGSQSAYGRGLPPARDQQTDVLRLKFETRSRGAVGSASPEGVGRREPGVEETAGGVASRSAALRLPVDPGGTTGAAPSGGDCAADAR